MRISNVRILSAGLAFALGAFTATSANAQYINKFANDRGSYSNVGDHDSLNDGYLAGFDSFSGESFRNFFVFDIPTLTGSDTYTSAILNINNGGSNSPNAFDMVGRTFTISSVSTNVTALTNGGTGLTSVYNDLSAGTTYGSITFLTTPTDGSVLKFNFNAAGVAAINSAAGGQIAFGGSFDITSSVNDQYVFAYTATGSAGDANSKLFLVMNNFVAPEPSSLALMALAPIGFGLIVRRRSQKKN